MDIRERNAPLAMWHDDIGRAPRFELEEGFRLRGHEAGDDCAWVDLHLAADRYSEISPDLFWNEFGRDESALRQRQLYLLAGDGQVIGTASAWFGSEALGRHLGRIHWVAIHPDWQGRGLAKPLLSAACRRLAALGHRESYLKTSSARVEAINLYLSFGFRPKAMKPEDGQAWEELKPWLKRAR